MRIFISSLIGGFEAERLATKAAIVTLRHEPIMAEEFGAQPNSPQVACLQGLRTADLVILILGERYGQPQASGLSATHEEYREAKTSKRILAFVHEGISPEPAQLGFIEEVQNWEGGLFRQSYTDVENLRTLVTRALHDYELTTAQTPIDSDELRKVAAAMLPSETRSRYSGGEPLVCLAVAGGGRQQIIRAAVIEDQSFADRLQQSAQFGSNRLFDTALGTTRSIENDALVLRQESGASITLNEGGDLLLQIPLRRQRASSGFDLSHSSVVLEEDVAGALRGGFEFVSQVLEEVDATQRLSHVAIAVNLAGAEYRGWRTRAEHDANPGSIEIGSTGSRECQPILSDAPRPGLRVNQSRMVEDIVVRLRRHWRNN